LWRAEGWLRGSMFKVTATVAIGFNQQKKRALNA